MWFLTLHVTNYNSDFEGNCLSHHSNEKYIFGRTLNMLVSESSPKAMPKTIMEMLLRVIHGDISSNAILINYALDPSCFSLIKTQLSKPLKFHALSTHILSNSIK